MADKRAKSIRSVFSVGNAALQQNFRGNAVPRKEERPKIQRPEERLPRKDQEQKPRVVQRQQERISLTAVAGFMLVAVLAFGVLSSHIQLTGLYADTVAAQKELTQLQETNAKLETEYEEIFDTETLQQAANKAGLQEPAASQKVYMELSDPDNAIVYHSEDEATGWKGCVQAVKAFFTGISTYFS